MGFDSSNRTSKPPHSCPKSPIDKPLRSALKRRSTGASGTSLLGAQRQEVQKVVEASKHEMAASFLQYCAMCEKQITTPCNSILYCSEACRRKDGRKPLSAANISSTPESSVPSSPTRPILQPRSPTGTSFTDVPVVRIPPGIHDFKSDLDPTEWKPKLPRDHRRLHSEAFRYLSQFHRATNAMSNHDTQSVTDGSTIVSNTINDTVIFPSASMPMPSLANTPATISSSSLSSSAGYGHNGYDFSTRPLPTRHNPWYSVGGGGTPRGVDLVTPHVAPPIIVNEPTEFEQEDLWGKKAITMRGHRTTAAIKNDEGLGKLFNKA